MNGFSGIDPTYHKELFRVTDRMRRLKTDPESFTIQEYRNLLAELCGSFRQSFDNGLNDAINFGAGLAANEAYRMEAQAVVRDMKAFSRFLDFEKKTLVACGATEEAASDMVSEITNLREQIAVTHYDADVVRECAERYRDGICRASEEVTEYVKSEQTQLKDKKRALATYGTAITLANASGIAITGGAAAPFLLLSSAIGGSMLFGRGVLPDRTQEPPRLN
ncbi:hypothetical protein [Rhizorhapis sp. SPR117]|uniref:hypothetical protein n=1 Tax=Rhizorhapis sp. SPR117 TaxID=2912611 RepID=UPI001F29F199|nr:hypothetical protein [Rhizorhapis sp. SPR117]